MSIPKKTLEDLEYHSVINNICKYSITKHGKEKIKSLKPSHDYEKIFFDLNLVSEYLSSLESENNFPNHGFDSISGELKMIKLENSQLEIESFKKIEHLCDLTFVQVKFLKKFKTYYPAIFSLTRFIKIEKDIIKEISRIIDKYAFIKDSASTTLFSLRKEISEARSKIIQTFSSALTKNNKLGFLDEINESTIDNRRVLAVKAMYRRKVKGQMMGSSKTGGIVYIEPQETLIQSRKLQDLLYDEEQEIKKILKELTDYLRPYSNNLENYQTYLTEIDFIYSKAKYSKEINATKPILVKEKKIVLKNAYHPLLYTSNKQNNIKTFPQSINIDDENRIIVISGPNAGGKSITLKTIGLLQLMVQSGILVPVDAKSEFCVFKTIISDIGDNQSIENQLSTYSYRLNNMKGFLKKCDNKTMFLIDEFGTGSDPELGGALAEIFLEVFYERKSFGVITTHYSNLKLLASELPYMSNANMEFDDKSLKPTFNLIVGEAGSSFTFEVAQNNGIPFNLINKAKKKIERGKLRFDATILKLQKQRSKLDNTTKSLIKEEEKFKKENEKLSIVNKKIKSKLINYQELFDGNQRIISIGNKLNQIADKYFETNKKRVLVKDLINLVDTMNSKKKKTNVLKRKLIEKTQKKISKQVTRDLSSIRKEKKNNVKKRYQLKENAYIFKVGDLVRIKDSISLGTIDKIEKNKAIVNYGNFTTKVDTNKLELGK